MALSMTHHDSTTLERQLFRLPLRFGCRWPSYRKARYRSRKTRKIRKARKTQWNALKCAPPRLIQAVAALVARHFFQASICDGILANACKTSTEA